MLATLVKKIEVQYLRLLVKLLKNGTIDAKKAKLSAKLFLTFLPFKDIDDLKTKIKIFSDTYPEFTELQLFLLKEVEELETKEVLAKMRKFMKNKDVDSAINAVTK